MKKMASIGLAAVLMTVLFLTAARAADYRLEILGVTLDVPLRTVTLSSFAVGTVFNPAKLTDLGFTGVEKGDKVNIYNKDNNGHWQVKLLKTGQEKEATLGYEEPDRCGNAFGCP